MKKTVSILTLSLYLIVPGLYGQQNYQSSMTGDLEDNLGLDLYELAADVVVYEEGLNSNNYERDSSERDSSERDSSESKTKTSETKRLADELEKEINKYMQMLVRRKQALIKQANRQLEHEMSRRKSREKLDQRRLHMDKTLAEAWIHSRTGKLDGRLWYQLMSDEQDMYRQRYMEFMDSKEEIENDDFNDPDNFFIGENEFANAWEANREKMGSENKWRDLSTRERSKFRKGYKEHQIGIYYLAKSMESLPVYTPGTREVDLALLR